MISRQLNLTAQGNGVQLLHFVLENNELNLALTGKYKGEKIQIDFDELSIDDVSEVITTLKDFRKKMQPKSIFSIAANTKKSKALD